MKPLDVGDETVTIQLLLTCGRVITEIKQHTSEPKFLIEHEDLMIPFKCYLNCDLKDCHSVKRLRVLKNIQEKYETIVFHPVMPQEELLRVYISLEISHDISRIRRKGGKDDEEDKLIFDMIVAKKKRSDDSVLSEHSIFYKSLKEGALSRGDKNVKMRKIQHDSFFISQGMISIFDTEPLKEDEYYLV